MSQFTPSEQAMSLHYQLRQADSSTPDLFDIYQTISQGESRGIDVHTLVEGYLEAKLFMSSTSMHDWEAIAAGAEQTDPYKQRAATEFYKRFNPIRR